jgi:hypothetical protein
MNAYLKEIADLCDIDKNLTCHTARHTFASTIALNNGVPIETVADILGHKTLKQTQHYAKLSDARISRDMIALHEKMIDKPEPVVMKQPITPTPAEKTTSNATFQYTYVIKS